MRLRTKLVLTATGLTFGIVLVLSFVFLGELLRQRIEQTSAANDVLAREVLLATRAGGRDRPPRPSAAGTSPAATRADEALHAAVLDALAQQRRPAQRDERDRPLLAHGGGRQRHRRPRLHHAFHRSRRAEPARALSRQLQPRARRQRLLPDARGLRKAPRARHRRAARPQSACRSSSSMSVCGRLPAQLPTSPCCARRCSSCCWPRWPPWRSPRCSPP